MKEIILLLFMGYCILPLFGQGYNTIGGIRFGTDWGITAKHRIDDKITVEGIFQSSTRREEVLVTALVAKHNPLITKRFNFYTGGGLHFGINSEANTEVDYNNPFGVTGIAGVEFKIARLILSWDIKPAINLAGGTKRIYTQSGISLRYVFVKKPLFKKNRNKKMNWKFWEKRG